MSFEVVTDRSAADVLRGDGADYLCWFVGEDATVAGVAAASGRPLHRVYDWVRRLVDVGLLEVARVEPRGGRPVKHYRAVADAFEVPPDLLPEGRLAAELRAAADEVAAALDQEFLRDVGDIPLRVTFGSSPSGPIAVRDYTPRRLIENPTPTPATWQTLSRTYRHDDAVELVRAVRAVLADFAEREVARGTPGAREYTIVFSIAPSQD